MKRFATILAAGLFLPACSAGDDPPAPNGGAAGTPTIPGTVGPDGLQPVRVKGEGLVGEAADLIFHLAVLLESHGLDFEAVLGELERRESVSGLTEKASRSGVMPLQRGD